MNRRLWFLLALIFILPASPLRAAHKLLRKPHLHRMRGRVPAHPLSQMQMLHQEQKRERRSLKLQQRAWKRSYRGRRIPRAEKIQMKHQMARDMRNLRQQQRQQLQDAKDHRRLLRARDLGL